MIHDLTVGLAGGHAKTGISDIFFFFEKKGISSFEEKEEEEEEGKKHNIIYVFITKDDGAEKIQSSDTT